MSSEGSDLSVYMAVSISLGILFAVSYNESATAWVRY